MPTVPLTVEMQELRQRRLIRNALQGSVNWLKGKLPYHAIDFTVDCQSTVYTLRVTIETLPPEVMNHFDKAREATLKECGSVGNISLKAVA